MPEIQSATRQEPKYTIRVYYVPDQAAVQSVTIWNEGMTSEELGELITALDKEYQPLRFVIIKVGRK